MPTALFFNAEEHRTHFGRDAIAQYLEGTEGRLMRSLKSLLGSALLQDKTAVHQQLISYQDVISLFLRMLAQKAQADLGGMPGRVVMGRPVHFVDDDPCATSRPKMRCARPLWMQALKTSPSSPSRLRRRWTTNSALTTRQWCWWWTLAGHLGLHRGAPGPRPHGAR